jgi:hypothetical protein
MNGRPKSHLAMRKAVQYAKWDCPTRELRQHYSAHKAMLCIFAEYADAMTGAGALVSNRMLIEGTGLSERFIRNELPVLEFELKLISCTSQRKGGRGKAPRWTINLSNTAFPDRTPTGEWLIDKGGTKGGTDSAKGGTDSTERGHSEGIKGARGTPKGGIQRGTQSEPHQKLIHPPSNGSGAADFNYQKLPEKMQFEPASPLWRKYLSENGNEVMYRAVLRWESIRGTRGLEDYWGFFLKECGPCIQWARDQVAEEQRRNDPVKKAEDEKRQREFEKKAGGLLDGMTERPDEGPQVTRLDELD